MSFTEAASIISQENETAIRELQQRPFLFQANNVYYLQMKIAIFIVSL